MVLAFGDYLLWNWSVGGNRDVLALVAGVTLIPLSIAAVWLAVLAVAHLCAGLARRSRYGAAAWVEGNGRAGSPNGGAVSRAWGAANATAAASPADGPHPAAGRHPSAGLHPTGRGPHPAPGARHSESPASPSSQLAA